MEQEDAKWIQDSVGDQIHDEDVSFEGEVYLSTDGKHTVHVKASTQEGRKAALAWAKAAYDRIRFTYGTKQEANKKTYNGEEDLGKCVKCGAANAKSMKGKIYCSAKCWL